MSQEQAMRAALFRLKGFLFLMGEVRRPIGKAAAMTAMRDAIRKRVSAAEGLSLTDSDAVCLAGHAVTLLKALMHEKYAYDDAPAPGPDP